MPARNKPPVFPVRLKAPQTVVIIRLPRNYGGNAKVYLREIAKQKLADYYFLRISCAISGRTDRGVPIPIDIVGRWLFGTLGYMGHISVSNNDGLDAKVEYPLKSPSVVHTLVAALKAVIEGLHE